MLTPSYFQKYIGKEGGEYRITIIGREVFSVRIDSSNPIDWRKSDSINQYNKVEIPQHILTSCFNLMEELSIPFGAFDFIQSGSEFYFLEVNPNGQWLWLEEQLGLPISRSIVDYLQKGA